MVCRLQDGEGAVDAQGGEGGGSASMTYADGKLYIRYSDGWVALVDATADKYTELGAFKVPNGRSNTWRTRWWRAASSTSANATCCAATT